MKRTEPPDATPVPADWERDLLVPLMTMAALNAAEQHNIVAALRFVHRNARFEARLLSIDGLKKLHEKMFNAVWRWAGAFRQRNLNLGIEWGYIATQTQNLCDDTKYWIEHETHPWVERAVRFHHRLVSIHPFENGNGRHARIAANVLLQSHGQPRLPWGQAHLGDATAVRAAYIAALRQADSEVIEPLIEFAQSGETKD